jgi:arginyl-tRNA synthetase
VIDARQSYLQRIVKAGLEALDHASEAEASIHFAYEMVSLSAETARQLGYLDDDDEAGASLEMSGRKGIGVKADDLLDQLEAKSREEIAARHLEMPETEVELLARQIAIAALRFFMAKASTPRVIAFDLEEALSFEGESGPYLQYSCVRARNIQRKLDEQGLDVETTPQAIESVPAEAWSDDLWNLALTVGQIPDRVRTAGETLELSVIARHALELAQQFNAIYHKHPVLHEEDASLRTARLAAVRVFLRGLEELAGLLGVPLPERM